MLDAGKSLSNNFEVLGKCDSLDATWEIYIYVLFQPKDKTEFTEEDFTRVIFSTSNPSPMSPLNRHHGECHQPLFLPQFLPHQHGEKKY